MHVNIQEELDAHGIEYTVSSEYVRVLCPFHEDTHPSLDVYFSTQRFVCRACNKKGEFIAFLAKKLNVQLHDIYRDLRDKYAVTDENYIPQDIVETYHQILVNRDDDNRLIKALAERQVSRDIIKEYRLGEYQGRITIPITNRSGYCVNIRRYLPGAKAKKVINTKGYGKDLRLYPAKQLDFDTIVICGGEIKALAAANVLNSHGIGAVTATGGEGAWDHSLNQYFADKKVYICLDIDAAGKAAAQILCTYLYAHVEWIGRVELPLDVKKFPKGDINDFLFEGGDLHKLIQSCPQWELKLDSLNFKYNELEEASEVALSDAYSATHIGKKIGVKALVSSVAETPYSVPKIIRIKCDRQQKMCPICPVFITCKEDEQVITIGKENPCLLAMLNVSTKEKTAQIKEAIGIPATCKSATVEDEASYHVEECRISSELDISNRQDEKVMQPAYCISDASPKLEINEVYDFSGRLFPSPRTQESTLLLSTHRATKDALSLFEVEDYNSLKVFQPEEWSIAGISRKLSDLYTDIENNVTHIYHRRTMHIAMDLFFHSPLFMTIDNGTKKGWTDILVVGDSSCGKTETADRLQEHYQVGYKLDCEGATKAGLLGGVHQVGNSWHTSWGIIPQNDKRAVILDELSKLNGDAFSGLRDMRSSGIADLNKIRHGRAFARTRLLSISNPASNYTVGSYNYGVDMILELIKSLPDIRRFDFFVIVSKDTVTEDQIYAKRKSVEHVFTSNLCRELILWSWTSSNCVFENESLLFSRTKKLYERYCDDIPIVDIGTTKLKVARLAAALAARTFSHVEGKPKEIFVRDCHVEFVIKLMDSEYASDVFGYLNYSTARRAARKLQDPERIENTFRNTIPFPKTLVKTFLRQNFIDIVLIQDVLAWDRKESAVLLSYLIRHNALEKAGKAYKKTPEFVDFLKSIEDKLVDGSPIKQGF